jgi:hypothetical protein
LFKAGLFPKNAGDCSGGQEQLRICPATRLPEKQKADHLIGFCLFILTALCAFPEICRALRFKN